MWPADSDVMADAFFDRSPFTLCDDPRGNQPSLVLSSRLKGINKREKERRREESIDRKTPKALDPLPFDQSTTKI